MDQTRRQLIILSILIPVFVIPFLVWFYIRKSEGDKLKENFFADPTCKVFLTPKASIPACDSGAYNNSKIFIQKEATEGTNANFKQAWNDIKGSKVAFGPDSQPYCKYEYKNLTMKPDQPSMVRDHGSNLGSSLDWAFCFSDSNMDLGSNSNLANVLKTNKNFNVIERGQNNFSRLAMGSFLPADQTPVFCATSSNVVDRDLTTPRLNSGNYFSLKVDYASNGAITMPEGATFVNINSSNGAETVGNSVATNSVANIMQWTESNVAYNNGFNVVRTPVPQNFEIFKKGQSACGTRFLHKTNATMPLSFPGLSVVVHSYNGNTADYLRGNTAYINQQQRNIALSNNSLQSNLQITRTRVESNQRLEATLTSNYNAAVISYSNATQAAMFNGGNSIPSVIHTMLHRGFSGLIPAAVPRDLSINSGVTFSQVTPSYTNNTTSGSVMFSEGGKFTRAMPAQTIQTPKRVSFYYRLDKGDGTFMTLQNNFSVAVGKDQRLRVYSVEGRSLFSKKETLITSSKWYFIEIRLFEHKASLYIDGVLQDTGDFLSKFMDTNPVLSIGNLTPTSGSNCGSFDMDSYTELHRNITANTWENFANQNNNNNNNNKKKEQERQRAQAQAKKEAAEKAAAKAKNEADRAAAILKAEQNAAAALKAAAFTVARPQPSVAATATATATALRSAASASVAAATRSTAAAAPAAASTTRSPAPITVTTVATTQRAPTVNTNAAALATAAAAANAARVAAAAAEAARVKAVAEYNALSPILHQQRQPTNLTMISTYPFAGLPVSVEPLKQGQNICIKNADRGTGMVFYVADVLVTNFRVSDPISVRKTAVIETEIKAALLAFTATEVKDLDDAKRAHIAYTNNSGVMQITSQYAITPVGSSTENSKKIYTAASNLTVQIDRKFEQMNSSNFTLPTDRKVIYYAAAMVSDTYNLSSSVPQLNSVIEFRLQSSNSIPADLWVNGRNIISATTNQYGYSAGILPGGLKVTALQTILVRTFGNNKVEVKWRLRTTDPNAPWKVLPKEILRGLSPVPTLSATASKTISDNMKATFNSTMLAGRIPADLITINNYRALKTTYDNNIKQLQGAVSTMNNSVVQNTLKLTNITKAVTEMNTIYTTKVLANIKNKNAIALPGNVKSYLQHTSSGPKDYFFFRIPDRRPA